MKRPLLALLSAATLVAGSAIISSPAVAGGHGHGHGHGYGQASPPRTIADGLFTPLKLAVDDRGRAYVSQNFLGELTRIKPDGTKTSFATVPDEEVGGVDERHGKVYWTTTAPGSAKLFSGRRGQEPRELADFYAYESTENPDGDVTYGFRDLPADCADQFPDDNPASYTGIVDSHPYATLASKRKTYVADAAANTIFSVGRHGTVKTAVLLPAVGTVVTAEALEAQELPTCAAGHTYYFEFVPTDVEKGRDGWLYVTSLPGGPEDASLGARGGLFKVNPSSGKVRKVAGGFVGAVDLAIGRDGRIAVAELFGGPEGAGQVTLVKPYSSYRKTLALTSPAAVEWVGGKRHSKLYATTNAFVDGAPAPVGKLEVVSFRSHRR